MIELFMHSLIKEHFDNGKREKKQEFENEYENENYYKYDFYYFVFYFIIYFVIGIIAAGMSWKCNEKSNYPLLIKICCAFNAFGFGILYIIFYFFYYAMSGAMACKEGYYVSFKEHEKDFAQLQTLIAEYTAKASATAGAVVAAAAPAAV
jgi:hypothetical protein